MWYLSSRLISLLGRDLRTRGEAIHELNPPELRPVRVQGLGGVVQLPARRPDGKGWVGYCVDYLITSDVPGTLCWHIGTVQCVGWDRQKLRESFPLIWLPEIPYGNLYGNR